MDLIGAIAGAPGGPLAIITAVLGSIVCLFIYTFFHFIYLPTYIICKMQLASCFGHKMMTMFLSWRERRLLDLEEEKENTRMLEISVKEDMVVFHDVIDGEDVVLHQVVEDDWVLL